MALTPLRPLSPSTYIIGGTSTKLASKMGSLSLALKLYFQGEVVEDGTDTLKGWPLAGLRVCGEPLRLQLEPIHKNWSVVSCWLALFLTVMLITFPVCRLSFAPIEFASKAVFVISVW